MQIYATGFLALILFPFLLLTLYVLRRQSSTSPSTTSVFDFWETPERPNILILLIPALVAIPVFAMLYKITGAQDIAWPFFLITSLWGAGLYIRALLSP